MIVDTREIEVAVAQLRQLRDTANEAADALGRVIVALDVVAAKSAPVTGKKRKGDK